MVNNYLLNRKIKTKVGSSYGTWEEILFEVVQGSVLETLLFNIFLSDFLLSLKIITLPVTLLHQVLSELNEIAAKLFAWFDNNQIA